MRLYHGASLFPLRDFCCTLSMAEISMGTYVVDTKVAGCSLAFTLAISAKTFIHWRSYLVRIWLALWWWSTEVDKVFKLSFITDFH